MRIEAAMIHQSSSRPVRMAAGQITLAEASVGKAASRSAKARILSDIA
jgi:hypothetical protein